MIHDALSQNCTTKKQQYFRELTLAECFLYYEDAKLNSDLAQELKFLLIILEKSLMDYQDYLIFDYFETAQQLCKQLDDSKSYTQLLHLVASVYFNLLNYKTALVYFKRSAKIALQNKHFEIASIQYSHIAKCYIKLDQVSKALQFTHTARYIANRAQIENPVVTMYFTVQYVEIYFQLKNFDQAHASAKFLDFFIEHDFFEREKAMIHLLKAKIAAANSLYNDEYTHLKLANNYFLLVGDLQKQLHTVELLLNCPALYKTSTHQTNFMHIHATIVQQIKNTYHKQAFRKALASFNAIEQQTTDTIHAHFETSFFSDEQLLLKNRTHLFVITFAKDDAHSAEEQQILFSVLQKTMIHHLTNENYACGFYYNQLVIAFNDIVEINALSQILTSLQQLHDKEAQIVYGYSCSTLQTTSIRELYNFAYAQHYYMLDSSNKH